MRGNWETYTYVNGKPGGIGKGLVSMSNQPPTNWVTNAGMPIESGDKCNIAILATTYPLGRGNPEGFALRHLRLRFAGGYTGDRMPFYSGVFNAGLPISCPLILSIWQSGSAANASGTR